jgi:glutamate-1-semialdehyde 2,1-aminomutase
MVLAIIQARMGSTRLPGKVMKAVLGKPLVGHLLERLSLSKKIDRIVVATSVDGSNDVLCDYVKSLGFEVYRGSENDVLDRYYQAARRYGADTVVRITADCPLIDYLVTDRVIELFEKEKADYASNNLPPTFPNGLDTEVVSFNALETAHRQAKLEPEREHVTPYVRNTPSFTKAHLENDADLSAERWTVDREEDFILVKDIIEHLYRPDKYFGMSEILAYKRANPEIFRVNSHIRRNEKLKT